MKGVKYEGMRMWEKQEMRMRGFIMADEEIFLILFLYNRGRYIIIVEGIVAHF